MKALRQAAIVSAILGSAAGLGQSAHAAYTVIIMQEGVDVVATGSGSIDLSGLLPLTPNTEQAVLAHLIRDGRDFRLASVAQSADIA